MPIATATIAAIVAAIRLAIVLQEKVTNVVERRAYIVEHSPLLAIYVPRLLTCFRNI